MNTKSTGPQYRIMGAPSRETQGYVLGYATTERGARAAATRYSKDHTVVWIQRRRDNGEYTSY